MPSESSGKTITRISVLKDKINIFFGKDKLEVSYDTYTSHYFFVGKELSFKEIEDIQKENDINGAIKVAKGILLKKMASEWTIRNKLYDKGYDKGIVDEVVVKLKKDKLIDDSAFVKEYIAYYDEKLYGKNKIIQELRLKGIFNETIQEIKFSEINELKKAKKLLPKLEKEYAKYNTVSKRQHIYNALIRYGYSNEIANEVTIKAKANSPKEEKNTLKKDFDVVYKKGKQKYKTSDGVKNYVIKTLNAKGYKYNEIIKMWEEMSNE